MALFEMLETVWEKIYCWIRCTLEFNAGSRIIEKKKLRGVFFLFLAPAGSLATAWPYPNPFSNPAGQS